MRENILFYEIFLNAGFISADDIEFKFTYLRFGVKSHIGVSYYLIIFLKF